MAIITITDWIEIQEIIDDFNDCYVSLNQHKTRWCVGANMQNTPVLDVKLLVCSHGKSPWPDEA